MATKADQADEQIDVKRYEIQYPISAYTFPTEARIHQVAFDNEYLHIALTDGRKVSIPLWWIPTLYNAPPEGREQYKINRSRTMLTWDPEASGINEEVRIVDYLGPSKPTPE